MQRFLKDLLCIKAEIICEQFSPQFLLSFLNAEELQDTDKAIKAVKLLKSDKLRSMVIDLETDGCYDTDREEEHTLNVLRHVNEIINMAFGIVSNQPALLPLYKQMLESAVATMPKARQFGAVLDTAFRKIDKELNTPEANSEPKNDPSLELQKQKNNQDYAIKKEQNEIKREELNLKKAEALADYIGKEK